MPMRNAQEILPTRLEVRARVLQWGRQATAYQILNPGFAHWWSGRQDAVAGYVDHGGYRVVAGGPVGPGPRLPEVIAELEAGATRAGRCVCWFGVESWMLPHWSRAAPHGVVLLGAQPSWSPRGWLDGVARRAPLRAQCQRARHKGVVVREETPGRAALHPGVEECLRHWLARRGLPPMHFLVEPETLENLEDRRLFVACRDGEVIGFLVASPVPLRRGWLIEQWVRGAGAVNGTVELLLRHAMETLHQEGSQYVTLGLAALSRRAGLDYSGNPFWLRWVLAWARAHGRRFYNFEGLDAFKAKFGPEAWEPIHAVTNRPQFTPAALYAIAAAFSSGSPVRMIGGAGRRALRMEWGWFVDWLLGRS